MTRDVRPYNEETEEGKTYIIYSMTLVKSIKLRNVFYVLAFIFIVGLIVWTQYRPYSVTKMCHKVALDESGYQSGGSSRSVDDNQYANVFYLCMHKEGLNP